MPWLKREVTWWGLCEVIFVSIMLAGSVSCAPGYHSADGNSTPPDYWAQITKIATNGSGIEVRKITDKNKAGPPETLTDPTIKAQLKSGDLKAGDVVRVTGTQPGGKLGIAIRPPSSVDAGSVLLTMTLMAVILICVIALLARGKLRWLIVGADNRYSKSKVQFMVWLVVVLTVYLSALWLRFWYSDYLLLGGIQIPAHLLQLAGLSGLSMAAAKGITQSKQSTVANQQASIAAAHIAGAAVGMTPDGREVAAFSPAGGLVPEVVLGPAPSQIKTSATNPSWRDLLGTDSASGVSALDLGDFQMLLVTLIALVIYLVSAYLSLSTLEWRASISLPEVDQTLLGLLGVSHLTYLSKKGVTDPSPNP
jgi:hypothetical protein